MKKGFLLFVCLLFLWGCQSGDNAPERVASRFLEAYYTHRFEKAIHYADPETARELQTQLNQMEAQGISAADWESLADQEVIVEIQGIVANDGYQALCAYKIKTSPDDANALIETLLLTQTDRGWKVSF
ncbi:MAG: hypothetical protein LBM20_04340 [Rikenellaceae bacterium]|jgi:hypothetical protein|nr:hypothetical protein [Rikenellaceae bacterium]